MLGGDEGVENVLRRRGDDYWRSRVRGDSADRRRANWGVVGDVSHELWSLATRVFIQPAGPGRLMIS